jgi:hypothetical protein
MSQFKLAAIMAVFGDSHAFAATLEARPRTC